MLATTPLAAVLCCMCRIHHIFFTKPSTSSVLKDWLAHAAPAWLAAAEPCLLLCWQPNTALPPCVVQEDWLADLNPESLVVVKGAYATPDLAKAKPGDRSGVQPRRL